MKKLFTATVSIAALSAAALYGASAFAADLPTKAPVYKAAAPGYNWTGWYGGVNVGVGVAQTSGTINSLFPGPSDRSAAGFAGGVQAGFNWQVAPQWVVGVEGDIGYLGIKRSFLELDNSSALGIRTDWYGTLRGRLGYTNGPSLFYATGGAAFVNLKNNHDNDFAGLVIAEKSETATGWTVGGGIETMLGGNWSAKAEYLYIDSGSQDVFNSFTSNIVSFDNRFHVYRYGVNYKFGGPAVASALPVRTWTGFYTGMHAGAGLSQDAAIVPFNNDPRFGNSVEIAGYGFTGGVQAGYNWQFNQSWVAGIEGDIGYLGIRGLNNNFDNSGAVFGLKTDWYGTLRGRVGYSTGPALLYVTGGAAFVNVRNNFDSTTPPILLASKSKTATGWTVGGGIESALAQNWTAKTEYLYIDAGSQDIFNSSILFNLGGSTAHFDNRFHVFRFGVNYQFTAAPVMAPVAARY